MMLSKSLSSTKRVENSVTVNSCPTSADEQARKKKKKMTLRLIGYELRIGNRHSAFGSRKSEIGNQQIECLGVFPVSGCLRFPISVFRLPTTLECYLRYYPRSRLFLEKRFRCKPEHSCNQVTWKNGHGLVVVANGTVIISPALVDLCFEFR